MQGDQRYDTKYQEDVYCYDVSVHEPNRVRRRKREEEIG